MLRLALAQLNFTVGAFDANFAKMADAVGRAEAAGADLVVFSELAATGYPPRDLLTHDRFVDENLRLVDRIAALSTAELGILLGFVDRNPAPDGKRLYNAAGLCHRGRLVERRYKSLLPTYDVFDEDRYFEPARDVSPMAFKGLRLGVSICEDVWNDRELWPTRLYHRDPISDLAAAGADVFINISASPFSLDKADLRRRLVQREALQHRRHFFYLNQVGGNDELVFDGHSIAVDPEGREVLRARDFEEDFAVYDLPTRGAEMPRDLSLAPVSTSLEEAAWKALALGLRDYAHKCGFSEVVIGLSGGIDSALTACLAVDALGASRVHTVALPTRYSSPGSLADAAALAETLGIHHQVIDIDAMLQAYLDGLTPAFAGRPPDVTEENIQARIRGGVLMALSNKFGYLLLTTGNKSELAVGYCTLYGDMCGGLAAISDVPKTFVYRLAHYVNRDSEIIPASTMTKPPSAELRPDQTDQDSLPPYEVVDAIVEAYVERQQDVDAIAALGIDADVAIEIIRRIDASEYKRRQAAPGLRISSKAFGLGRRFPVAADYRHLRLRGVSVNAAARGTP